VLFRPFSLVLEQRDAKTHGTTEAADADRLAARDLLSRFDAGLAEARAVAHAQAEVIRQETQAREKAIFEEAKTAVNARQGALRAALEKEAASARESLRSDARAMADEMVATVLGKKA
jgi:F0F1-type ATP synthase membrane subunit b/b'